MKPRSFVSSLLLVCIFALLSAQACGPDFAPDAFVRKLRPDKPKEFATGKLGVLLPTYPRTDLTVAFRYLNGGTLNAAEQAAYTPTYNYTDPEWEQQWNTQSAQQAADDPVAVWRKLRARFSGAAQAVQTQKTDTTQDPGGYTQQSSYDNCNADAFRSAAATLQARAKAWGGQSADLADWLHAQDTVFNNCAQGPLQLPAPAPATSSALLKADRAYQQAAALFYAASFPDARKGFEAVAPDANSPWRTIAPYLAARCLVRQAFHDAKGEGGEEMATFDPALMKQAAVVLQSLLKENQPGAPRRAIQNELDLVRMRTEPVVRAGELAAALAGPKTDAGYSQHLRDLTWYLNLKLDGLPVRVDFSNPNEPPPSYSKAYADLAPLRASAPLVDWLITFQSPAVEAKDHAIAEWKSTHQAFWLLAAAAKASENDASAADLVEAAAQISPDAPAWESFTYHRIRLLIAMGHTPDARALLAQTLPQIRAGGHDSSVNLFLGLQARAANSLNEFLTWAPRKTISATSESQSSLSECIEVMKSPKRVYDCAQAVSPVQFSADAADVFNTQAPLATLVQAANSSTLPQQLRTSVAMMAWVRSVLLKDDATARKLLPLLPEKLRQQAAPGTGMHVLMAVLRNPGLRPYLDPGIQRSYSYDFVESYADNWWCQDWRATWNGGNMPLQPTDPAMFIAPEQRSAADAELATLVSEKGAAVYLGGIVLDFAQAHPDDEDVPESLYLLLRMIRYGCERGISPYDNSPGSQSKRVDDIRRTAARLLRQRYAANPWTKKAAPYVG